jgi:hypothetical protein
MIYKNETELQLIRMFMIHESEIFRLVHFKTLDLFDKY